jgi:tetratricopeptide (TPR) repeat protein
MARMDRGFDLDALGLAPQALAEYDRAVALLEGLARDGGDDELAGDLAAASMTRGDALRRLDRAAEAEPDYQRAIELYLRLGDEAATDLPRARAEKGRLLLTLGRWAEAAAEHEAAIALLEPQVELERQTNDVLRKLGGECRADTEDAQAVARMDRGDALKGLGRLGDAVAEYERAIAAWERLVREGIAGLADRLGAAVATGFEAHCQLRRWADAAADLRRGLAAAPGGDRPPEPVVEALRALSGEDRAAVEAHLGDVAPRVSGWLAGL